MRLWATAQETKRPIPTLSDDEVVDWLIGEAISVKVGETRKEKQEEDKRTQWRKSHRELAQSVSAGQVF